MSEPPPIERAFLREDEDGATVFFPWGLDRRGYRIPDEKTRKKASRAASTLIGATLAIGSWTAFRLQPLAEGEAGGAAGLPGLLAAPGAALGLVLLGYWLRVSRLVEGLQESSFRVPRQQRLREAAEIAAPWKVALFGAVLGGLSALLIVVQPHARWLGALGIGLGVGALFWSSLLKRAAARPSP